MTVSPIDVAIARIRSAPATSPIAVFRCEAPGYVNAVFANTARTRRRIDESDLLLIGVFDNASAPAVVRHLLAAHA